MLTSGDFTTSPDLSQDTSILQPSPSYPANNDPNIGGCHHSPSGPDPQTSSPDVHPSPDRHTSVQSVPRRMTGGGRTTTVVDSVGTQNRRASSMTLVPGVGTILCKLLVPKRKVGKAPGLRHELKTILFGSCTPCSLTFPSKSHVPTPSTGLNVLLLTIPISVRVSLDTNVASSRANRPIPLCSFPVGTTICRTSRTNPRFRLCVVSLTPYGDALILP